MLNVTGPVQSNFQPIQERPDQYLKVNQRIAGEILNISNEQVVLAVNGVQIVARMTSAEQLAVLMEKRYAYFTVKEVNEEQVTLQLINTLQSEESSKPEIARTIGQALLEQIGVEVSSSNLSIVQAALSRGLKITPELINEIKTVLDTNPGWGTNDAQLAATIKAMGLPLTEGSLSLAQNAIRQINDNFFQLFSIISQELNRPGLSPTIGQQLRDAQTILQNALILGGSSSEVIEKNLMNSINRMGISLEKEISNMFLTGEKGNQASRLNGVLFSLASLRHELSQTSFPRLTSAIDAFIQGMRWMHFTNVEPEQTVGKGQWTQMDLPITFGNTMMIRLQDDAIHNLQIRIAHDPKEESKKAINADYTRLVIQVDLDQENDIKVDLSIVSQMIGAEITATSDDLCQFAAEELDEFKKGLTNLGYTLKTSRVELGQMDMDTNIQPIQKAMAVISSVDLGI